MKADVTQWQNRKLTPNSNTGIRIEGDKATRESIASESQDRDNKLISGKMLFKTMKDGIEMLTFSWLISSTIILQDEK